MIVSNSYAEVEDMGEPKSAKEQIGNRIREARKAVGWTQKQLAKAVGFSPVAVGHWETGRNDPGPDTMYLIADALKKPFDFFYQDVNGDASLTDDEYFSALEKEQPISHQSARTWATVLPVVREVRQGVRPNMAGEYWVPVPPEFGRQADFIVRLARSSGVEAGLAEDDYVLVRSCDQAEPGDIVVVTVGTDSLPKLATFRDGAYFRLTDGSGQIEEDVRLLGRYKALLTRQAPTVDVTVASRQELWQRLALAEGVDTSTVQAVLAAVKALKSL